jgi:hypothetical protein
MEATMRKRSTRGRELSVFDRHQLRIARQTLNMPDAMVGVMGGPNKAEAREIIRRLTGKAPKGDPRRRRGARRDPRRVVEQGYDVERIHLDRQGYTRHGQYYGTGQNLYRVTSRDTGRSVVLRAASAKDAKAEVLRKGAWKLYTLHRRAHEKWGAWRDPSRKGVRISAAPPMGRWLERLAEINRMHISEQKKQQLRMRDYTRIMMAKR